MQLIAAVKQAVCHAHFSHFALRQEFITGYPHKTARVPGEIQRREVELDPEVSPEEIMSREVELGCESWTSFALSYSSTAVQRTLSL